jgi:hypothetical protein
MVNKIESLLYEAGIFFTGWYRCQPLMVQRYGIPANRLEKIKERFTGMIRKYSVYSFLLFIVYTGIPHYNCIQALRTGDFSFHLNIYCFLSQLKFCLISSLVRVSLKN